MAKILVPLLATLTAALVVVLMFLPAACTEPITDNPTGCVTVPPDGGVQESCAIEWSCEDDSQHYRIDCTQSGSNFSCECSTDTTTTTRIVVVSPFICDTAGQGALPAASGCGWNIQM
jgi:hypothetical protein